MMRIALALALLAGAASAGAQTRDRCEHLFTVVFEFIADPAGKLTHLRFYPPVDCRKNTVSLPISKAWKKTACVAFILEGVSPTYKEGEEPKVLFSFVMFNSDRPDVVYAKRLVQVREEILKEGGSKGGFAVCDQNLDGPPLAPESAR